MKFITPAVIGAGLLLAAHAQAADPVLVWQDEFEGTSGYPDPQKWTYQTGGSGWGNNEAQYYTSRRDGDANAFIEDGKLIIEARKETFGSNNYTSARLNSAVSWKYGRIVVRARLPEGRGTWPAIWMMPRDSVYGGWPDSGEIDIMEHVGYDPGAVHANLHTEAENHMIGNPRGGSTEVPDFNTAYHDYRIDWTPDGIRAYVDDILYFYGPNEAAEHPGEESAYWPFDQPFYIILNIAIGGNWGGVEGIDDTIFPQRMEVEYVRVYDLGDSPQPTVHDLPGTVQAEAFADASGVQLEATEDVGGGSDVGYLNAGDWIDWVVTVPSAGLYSVDVRYASMNGNADFTLSDENGHTLDVSGLPVTGGWQNWATADCGTIQLDAGEQTLRMTVNPMATNDDFNLNWFRFSRVTSYGGADSAGWVENGLLGWVNVTLDPWIWADSLQNWFYAESAPADGGGWVYVVMPAK